jgi:hypothetical protein
MMSERYVPSKRRFLSEPHGVTSQKTAFFIDTAVKTSNFTRDTLLNLLSSFQLSGAEIGETPE